MNCKDILRPDISVIMSVYNSEKFLIEAIESILDQSHINFEFIITDDSSTDGSFAILEKYKSKDDRIILIKNSDNLGLTKNLNRMLDISKGKYIARMDADDISLPSRFKLQYNYMESNNDIGVLGTNIQFFGNYNERTKLPLMHDEIKVELLFRDVIMHPTVMIRKHIIDLYKFRYDESFKISQDYDLWCRMINHTNFANLSETLLYYRFESSNITNSTKNEYRETFLKKIYLLQLNNLGLTPAESEIITHLKLATNKILDKIEDLKHILDWMQCLIKANKDNKVYEPKLFENIISKYWFSICTNSTKFGLKTKNIYSESIYSKKFDPGFIYKFKFLLKCMIRYDRR